MNIDIRVQYCKMSPQMRRKILLVNHTIRVGDEENQTPLFGLGGDGVHYRGPVGSEEYSQSVLRALKQADGQMNPNQAILPTQNQNKANQVPVQNRFNIFNQLN